MTAEAATAARRGRIQTHSNDTRWSEEIVEGQWKCSCGRKSGNTAGTFDGHRERAAKATLKKIDDLTAGTLISMDAGGKGTGVLLWDWTHRRGGDLRRYVTPWYDGYGCFRLRLDYGRVLAALDAGELVEDDRCTEKVLRLALALAGHGSVRLDDLGDWLTREQREQALKAFAERLYLTVTIADGD